MAWNMGASAIQHGLDVISPIITMDLTRGPKRYEDRDVIVSERALI